MPDATQQNAPWLCPRCDFKSTDRAEVESHIYGGKCPYYAKGYAPCEIHPEVAATHLVRMKSSTAPYERDVPACEACARRLTTIGFTASHIDGSPWCPTSLTGHPNGCRCR